MVFDLTEEQRMIQDTAREFARKEYCRRRPNWTRTAAFPRN